MKQRHRQIVEWGRATAEANVVGRLSLDEALEFAHSLKYGLLVDGKSQPPLSVEEALDEIADYAKTCGYNSLTAAAAIVALADAPR